MTVPALFDYTEKPTEWLLSIYPKLGMFQGELRAKVLASLVAELGRRGLPGPEDDLPLGGGVAPPSLPHTVTLCR